MLTKVLQVKANSSLQVRMKSSKGMPTFDDHYMQRFNNPLKGKISKKECWQKANTIDKGHGVKMK